MDYIYKSARAAGISVLDSFVYMALGFGVWGPRWFFYVALAMWLLRTVLYYRYVHGKPIPTAKINLVVVMHDANGNVLHLTKKTVNMEEN